MQKLIFLLLLPQTLAIVPFLGGTDVVAYFSLSPDQPAIIGSPTYFSIYTSTDLYDDQQPNYMNTTFYFESRENLERFEEEPEMYLPAYGGFCE